MDDIANEMSGIDSPLNNINGKMLNLNQQGKQMNRSA